MTTQSGAETGTRSVWQLDPNHTLVEFSGKHMMFTTVKGHFKSVRGTIVLDEADPSRSSVKVEIDTPSLYSGVEYRDNHLKSPDFLDIENHPTITFKSTRVEPLGSDRARVIGDLTIHPRWCWIPNSRNVGRIPRRGDCRVRCQDVDQPQRLRTDLERGPGNRWVPGGRHHQDRDRRGGPPAVRVR